MASPTTLFIARHGEAHCNVDQIVGGPIGCRGLTDQGRAQVRRLAERLRGTQRSHPTPGIYASPLPRARESGELIAHELGARLTKRFDRPTRTWVLGAMQDERGDLDASAALQELVFVPELGLGVQRRALHSWLTANGTAASTPASST